MTHDADYFRRRAAEARAAASHKTGDGVEVAGQLALAYAALARRRRNAAAAAADEDLPGDARPLMLRD